MESRITHDGRPLSIGYDDFARMADEANEQMRAQEMAMCRLLVDQGVADIRG